MLKQLIESLESLTITHGDTTKKITSYDAAVIAKTVSEASDEQRETIANVAFKSYDHFKSLIEAVENKDTVDVEADIEADKSETDKMKDKIDAMKEEIAALEKSISETKGDDIEDISKDILPDAEKDTLDTIKKIGTDDVKEGAVKRGSYLDTFKPKPADVKEDDKSDDEELSDHQKKVAERIAEPGKTRDDGLKIVTPVSKRDDGLTPVKPVSSRGNNTPVTPVSKRDDGLTPVKPVSSRGPGRPQGSPNVDEDITPAMHKANLRSTSAQNDPKSIIHAKPVAKPAVKKVKVEGEELSNHMKDVADRIMNPPKSIKEDDAAGVGVKGDNDDQLDADGLSTIDLAQRSGEVEKDTTVKSASDGDKAKRPDAGNKELDDMVAKVSAALKGGKNPFMSGPFGRGR